MNIREQLETALRESVVKLINAGKLPEECNSVLPQVVHNKPGKRLRQGDYSSNIALILAKQTKKPIENKSQTAVGTEALARDFVNTLGEDSDFSTATADFLSNGISRVDPVPPGFLNFFLATAAELDAIPKILKEGAHYGDGDWGKGQRILLEFVSANPTGPLHIGHGRGAAYGAAVAKLLRKAGYTVDCEYYINDAGRQMDILAVSAWLRYLQIQHPEQAYPANAYQADYVQEIAQGLLDAHGDLFMHPPTELPACGTEDAESHIDALIDSAKHLLGKDNFTLIRKIATDAILSGIRKDLADFRVCYQSWFQESTLYEKQRISACLRSLEERGHCYQKDGALWFRSTAFGDDKDRVLVRENGKFTYFAPDIAYHLDKYARGYDRLLNIWGADHHGYAKRIKAAVTALGENAEKLDVLLVQFAHLWRGGEKLQMSTRSGQYVTLRDLYSETGVDAAHLFYNMRGNSMHLDFDLDLAMARSNENPVYYIQYAHARICSLQRQMHAKSLDFTPCEDAVALKILQEKDRKAAAMLADYPEVLRCLHNSGVPEPHRLVHWLKDLSNAFHSWYNECPILNAEQNLRNARMTLALAFGVVIENGLHLLDINAPKRM
ncbi:MAG: arginine--tRNA ligase [Candidatus Eutrophobiaceae bacterium]